MSEQVYLLIAGDQEGTSIISVHRTGRGADEALKKHVEESNAKTVEMYTPTEEDLADPEYSEAADASLIEMFTYHSARPGFYATQTGSYFKIQPKELFE